MRLRTVKKKMVYLLWIAGVIAFVVVFCFYILLTSVYVNQPIYFLEGKVVTLDAGHGGQDPGKVGTISNEDKLNLEVTLKIKDTLEKMGCKVILTREDSNGLYLDGATIWSKRGDMEKRREIINASNANMAISIHMNSHTDKVSQGAQVFYLKGNKESEKLAIFIKEGLSELTRESKRREIKPRDDLYILKGNNCPTIIVECGFLTEKGEEKLLNEEEYQQQIAYLIAKGVLKYFFTN